MSFEGEKKELTFLFFLPSMFDTTESILFKRQAQCHQPSVEIKYRAEYIHAGLQLATAGITMTRVFAFAGLCF